MTFTQKLKKELSILPIDSRTAKSELSVFLRLNGLFQFSRSGNRIEIQTQNPASARRIYILISTTYHSDIETNIEKSTNKNFKNLHSYSLFVSDNSERILNDLEIFPFSGQSPVPSSFLRYRDQQRAFMRAAFLSAGSMNDPVTKDYHLEIAASNKFLIEQLSRMMNRKFFALDAKTTDRRNKRMVYIKSSEHISRFLSVIGATSAMLEFEDSRIMSDMRNSANRLANADNANVTRLTRAAQKQIESLKLLERKGLLDKLPEKLKTVARLRLANPDAGLSDLADMIDDQKLTKSGINHRMRKLMEIAFENQDPDQEKV
ncbi:DNA-binding protein WhiA [Oenococcus alcoholitolerans]|uniref:Probable cell division protein WhiA n=1 Tax=Oenococcus alcoholitolerans TaxID=931074 RepID=A0ABR4XS33_9LACO|nr:sporulation protein [Oenococcus alcoholitolerans]